MIALGNVAIIDAVSQQSGAAQCLFLLMGVSAIV